MIAFAIVIALAPIAEDPSDVAMCVVDNDRAGVVALLKTAPGSEAQGRASKKLMSLFAGCDDNRAAFNVQLNWRDRAELANAEIINRTARGGVAVSPTRASAKNWRIVIPAKAVAGRDYGAADLGTRMFGECVVAAQPDAALRLLRSAQGSAEENAAIAELAPSLGPCLPTGQNIRVKRPDLRFVVAEPLYHLIVG